MSAPDIDFGSDCPPLDHHPVDTTESLADAMVRFDRAASDAVDEVRGRLALALAAAERTGWHPGFVAGSGGGRMASHATDWARWRAQRLRVELAAIEVWRNRRLAEWMLAHHARWAGIRDASTLQRVVARAYSEIGAFFDPASRAFIGVDPTIAVQAAARSIGAKTAWNYRLPGSVH